MPILTQKTALCFAQNIIYYEGGECTQQLDNFILSAILDAKHCASREKVRVNKKYASKPKSTF